MPSFSSSSRFKLYSCDKKLQDLFNEVIKIHDCIILCGHRGKIDQDEAFNRGNSKLKYPKSKHNSDPSMAVDVAPYHDDEPHIHWNDLKDFEQFASNVKEIAKNLNINVKWGGDWESFKDYPHWEI